MLLYEIADDVHWLMLSKLIHLIAVDHSRILKQFYFYLIRKTAAGKLSFFDKNISKACNSCSD